MLVNILVAIGGILIFLFIFWKRMREDYASGIIFEVAAYILLGVGIMSLISSRLFAGWFFWVSMVGAAGGLVLGLLKFRLRFYESLEAVSLGLMPWLAFTFLKDSVVTASLSSFLAFLCILLIIFIFYFVDTHYREFTWYRSGKVGVAGLSSLAIIFTIRSAIALAGVHMLTFTGRFEAIMSGAVAFICFILIYNLSRNG